MKAGTGRLRSKVGGGRVGQGGSYGDRQYQRENIREIMKMCFFHLQQTNCNSDKKKRTINFSKNDDCKQNKFIHLEKYDFCR